MGQPQHHLGHHQGAEEGARHDQDGDDNELPALLEEHLQLVADGHAGKGPHHGQRRGEVDLPGGLNDKLGHGGQRAGAQQPQDGAVGHRGKLQGNHMGKACGAQGDEQQHQHAGQGLGEGHVEADEIGGHHAQAGNGQDENPILNGHNALLLNSSRPVPGRFSSGGPGWAPACGTGRCTGARR